MTGFCEVGLRDYGNERSVLRVKTADYDSAGFDALSVLRGAFTGAVQDMTELPTISDFAYGNETVGNPDGANSTYAQREMRWQVNYQDNTTKEYYFFSVFMPKTTLLDPDNKGYANMSDAGAVAAFVAAAQAFVLSPNGNAITIKSIKLMKGAP